MNILERREQIRMGKGIQEGIEQGKIEMVKDFIKEEGKTLELAGPWSKR